MPRSKQTRLYAAGKQKGALGAQLLNWFATHQRDLPWRRSQDPYRIWVSEVMLQQTRVETVIPYYERWFHQFPTLSSLADAPDDQVLKLWEGLGYYSRARNLHSAVKEVAARYGGEVPDSPEAIRSLKGIGPYTAGAVLSIAFNRPEPAVDGNVMRVLSRLYRIADDTMAPATRKAMESLAQELIPFGQARSFNQALMELGALICTPTSPKCTSCPVAQLCVARAEGVEGQLPVKKKGKAPRLVTIVAAVVYHGERVLIVKRPTDGLLGGLWEFPGGEHSAKEATYEQSLHEALQARFGLTTEIEAQLVSVKHIFTHLVWDLRAFTARVAPDSRVPAESGTLRWIRSDELHRFALPVAHQKVAQALLTCDRPLRTVQ